MKKGQSGWIITIIIMLVLILVVSIAFFIRGNSTMAGYYDMIFGAT